MPHKEYVANTWVGKTVLILVIQNFHDIFSILLIHMICPYF